MIRFQYGVYEDDMSLSKKEVNRRAKRDASTLLSAQEKLPDFTVWCGITDVSIAAYIVVAKLNGVWTFTMDHYYDVDGKVLKKLVDKAVSLTKLKELKGQEDFILESMMKVDGLREKSKTKYRSVFKINDEFLNSLKQQQEEIPSEEKPEEEPAQPTGEEIPQEKGQIPQNARRPVQPTQVQPVQPQKPEFQTPLPASQPEEPELKNLDKFIKDREKKQAQLAKDIKTQISKTSKQKLPQTEPIPDQNAGITIPEELPEPEQIQNDSDQIVQDIEKVSQQEPKEDNLEDIGEFPPEMFNQPEEEPIQQELPGRPPVTPVQRQSNITNKVLNDLPKGRTVSPIQIVDVDNITNPDISGENKQEEKRDAVQNIMNPKLQK